jgi:hypothetical protein
MRYGLGGVQSVPRVMRGSPVARGSLVDVPLSKRDLAGLESQGLARTLGSLGGCTLGEDIEMPEECMRPGEVLISPGVCGPDTRRPVDPYAAAPPTLAIPVSTTKTKVATSASSAAQGMSRTTMLVAAIGGIGLVYYLSTRKR